MTLEIMITAIASTASAENTTNSPTSEMMIESAKVIPPVHIYLPHLLRFVSLKKLLLVSYFVLWNAFHIFLSAYGHISKMYPSCACFYAFFTIS